MSTESQLFYIISEFKESGTSSNFTYKLDINAGAKFDRVAVLSLSIPFSFYLIRKPYDTFQLQEGSNTIEISVPEGNYTSTSFLKTVTGLLNENSRNGFTYSMTLNTTIAKYNFTVANNGDVQPVISVEEHLGDQLGFHLHSSNTLMSTRVINFVSTNCLYLHSDMVRDRTSILQHCFANNAVPYSYLTVNNDNVYVSSKAVQTSDSSLYNFSLTDSDGVEIDLNGQEIQFVLIMFKKDNLTEMFARFLKLQLLKESSG